jgi:hypothetical protein
VDALSSSQDVSRRKEATEARLWVMEKSFIWLGLNKENPL